MKKTNVRIYGLLNESLSPKHQKSFRMNPNISKYREFGELIVLVLDTRSNTASTYGTNVFIIIPITNEKSVKLMQIDRLLWTFTTSPADTRSNNSGRYTLLNSHIPWV